MVKVRKAKKPTDVCEMSLLIEKDEQFVDWDHDDLVKSIVDEVEIAESTAGEIADKAKNKIKDLCETMGWTSINSSFIREFVTNEVVALGKKYKKKAQKYNLIGMSPYEIKAVIENTSGGDNSNLLQNPESVNFNIAELVLKKYALQEIYSHEVSAAHINGSIYIHDLGAAPTRYYCSGNSVEYVKKHGLRLPMVHSVSAPAKKADVLVNHLLTFSAALQTQLAGAIGWDAVNVFIAPFLVGMNKKEIKQVAQKLIFGYSQLSSAKGGQAIFSDLNVFVEVPNHFKNTKAMGPGGKYYKLVQYAGKDILELCEKSEASTYWDFNNYAKEFIIACMDVLAEGDIRGIPFVFPKFLVHFSEDSFKPENKEVVDSIYSCASKNGSPYFIFDRGTDIKVGQCCRLSLSLTQEEIDKAMSTPEDIRFQALQNVTINLPQIAYKTVLSGAKSEKDKKQTFVKIMMETIDLAMEAHAQKKKHIKKLMRKDGGILKLFSDGMDGKGYADINNATYLIGLIGLNEVVQLLCGKQLHEDKKAVKLGMYIVAEMSLQIDKLGKKHGMRLALEESPAESASQRLAHIDMRNDKWGEFATSVVKGDLNTHNCYYTNSVHLVNEAGIDYIQRIITQGKFHPMIKGGAITHVWVGENLPSKESIENLVKKVFRKTATTQFTISPEYSVCDSCDHFMMGITEECSNCGSKETISYTRIVGYFSAIQNWSKNKKEELKHRERQYSKSW